jgi:NSS family neurotransmitter:Na+ symporter
VFSFNRWSGFRPLFDKTLFDLLDYLTANIMLPLGGLLIAIFAAWKLHQESSIEELAMGDGFSYRLWRGLVRYITPVAVIIVFLNAVDLI